MFNETIITKLKSLSFAFNAEATAKPVRHVAEYIVSPDSPPQFRLTEYIGDWNFPPSVRCLGVRGGLAPSVLILIDGECHEFRISEERYYEAIRRKIELVANH